MMNLDCDRSADDYIVTARQIFSYCGADNKSTLRVDVLMDKFAPFIKTNKAEYSYLKSLLDPDETNPEINVSELANTLDKYSESQKVKADLEESFNFKSGQVPHDSDSGISTDGFQLLEELQCELREKSHLVQKMRTQLDNADRHHEEVLAAVTAERDALRAHLNILREESTGLANIRRDYEEACERLCLTEKSLDETRRELDINRKKTKVLTEQVTLLETEKLTLHELLSKSKDECHRINDMYASRQSVLLDENETLRTEHADLSSRMQDQEEFMRQLIKRKELLEMEVKDLLNKSNQTHYRMDRSIDISYTEDQMLTALDSLNADSRFVQEGHLLDEESFVKALKEDQGRLTNMSLFDEIRLSFCNMSRHNLTSLNCTEQFEKTSDILDTSLITAGTQTEELQENVCGTCKIKMDEYLTNKIESEQNIINEKPMKSNCNKQKDTKNQSTNTSLYVLEVFKNVEVMNFGTQTENESYFNNNNIQNCINCTKCMECDRLNNCSKKLEKELEVSRSNVNEMQTVLNMYEDNLNNLKHFVDEGNEKNKFLKTVVEGLRNKVDTLELACDKQRECIQDMCCDTCSVEIQTDYDQSTVSTQTDVAREECVNRNTSRRNLKKYLWDPLKCLFQLFAVLCFACALFVLCGVSKRSASPCREAVPWRWLQPHDLVDLFLTIEYVDHVPM